MPHNKILEGRYRYIIVETIGRGSLGAVYKALGGGLADPVVIKEMSGSGVEAGMFKTAVKAWEEEVAALMSLKHHSLPRIIDFFSRGDECRYLVMEYIDGETLQSVARRRGAIPEKEVLAWGKQLCDVLSYLHNQKPPLFARGFQPSHIMLTVAGRIKLTGFGIARHLRQGATAAADTSRDGSGGGFLPPEQLKKGQMDQRSDIYSLGVTLHYLLTGEAPNLKPFKFDNPGAVVAVSAETDKAIMKAVEFKRDKRPATAREFKRMLPDEADLSPQSSKEEAGKNAPQKRDHQAGKVSERGTETGRRQPERTKTEQKKKKKAIIWLAASVLGLFLLAGMIYGAIYFISYFMGDRFDWALPGSETLQKQGQIGEGDRVPDARGQSPDKLELSIREPSGLALYITNVSRGSDLIFYKTPGSNDKPDDDVIGRYKKGWLFEVVDQHNNSMVVDGRIWWEVTEPLSGRTGWVAAEFLDKPEYRPFSGYEFGLERVGLTAGMEAGEVLEVLGAPLEDKSVDETEHGERILSYDGLSLGFYREDSPAKYQLAAFTINSHTYPGPRDIRVGDGAAAVLNKYLNTRHADDLLYADDADDATEAVLYHIEEDDSAYIKEGFCSYNSQTGELEAITYKQYAPFAGEEFYVLFSIEDGQVVTITRSGYGS